MTAEEQKLLMEPNVSGDAEFIYVGEPNPTASSPDNNGEDNNSAGESDPGTPRQVGGAAAAGCIAGLVLAGPLIALLTAAGAAMVATSRGKPGDVARRSGDAMADAGDRLKRFDKKHHVVEKSTRWVSKTFRHNQSSSSPRSSMVV